MRNASIFTTFLIFICVFNIGVSRASVENIGLAEAGLILDPAEAFFLSLGDREFRTAWDLLSEKSRDTIIDDVHRSSVKRGINITRGDIIGDFQKGGIIFQNYWNAFITNFDPAPVLNERVWEFEAIEPDEAVILLKSKAVTKLYMYKEGDQWKVGLVESFWAGRDSRSITFMRSLLELFL